MHEARAIAEKERAEADEAKAVAIRERQEADEARAIAIKERAEANAAKEAWRQKQAMEQALRWKSRIKTAPKVKKKKKKRVRANRPLLCLSPWPSQASPPAQRVSNCVVEWGLPHGSTSADIRPSVFFRWTRRHLAR